MKLTSTVFEHEGSIPSKYTCDGENINPPLEISNVAENSVSLVLIMEDPDVPKSIRPDGMWDHWLCWNIPIATTEIPEGQEPAGVCGNNTGGVAGYGGPCPPDREHRYFFKLFAIDTNLDVPQSSTKQEVLQAIEGHIIEESVLMGKYERV